jgi:ribosomal protein L35AE/L33A
MKSLFIYILLQIICYRNKFNINPCKDKIEQYKLMKGLAVLATFDENLPVFYDELSQL